MINYILTDTNLTVFPLNKTSLLKLHRTRVECGGQCVATPNCTAFEFEDILEVSPRRCPKYSKDANARSDGAFLCR